MLKYFTPKELWCPSTEIVKLADGFGENLDSLREKFGKPMTLTSACRTSAHINWLLERGYPASENSFHLIDNPKYGTDTCAVDVSIPDCVSKRFATGRTRRRVDSWCSEKFSSYRSKSRLYRASTTRICILNYLY